MKFRIATFLFVIILATLNVFATAQYPDKILFEGKIYSLHSNPLEAYFEKHPDKKPKSEIISSALWRGYVATFEITDNGLFLKDVEIMARERGKDDYGFKSVLSQVVPDGKKLKVDWFSGLLVLPFGKLVNYVHMGYGSTYENYHLIEIASGDFKRSKGFGFREYEVFKERQFAEFKKTPEYGKYIDDAKKEGNFDQKFTDDFLRSFITNYTSKILVD